jgi:hypothetical protein
MAFTRCPEAGCAPAGLNVSKENQLTDILRLLFDMRNGEVAGDISRHFDELKTAVIQTRGKGKLTIELSLEPSKCAIGGAVLEIKTKHICKVKKPELAVGDAHFFVTAEGDLTRDDPAQEAMFEEANKQTGQEQKRG